MAFPNASTTSSALPQSAVTYYEKKFVSWLAANTPALRCTTRRPLPLHSGNKIEFFKYNPFGGNTTQVTEGTVGTGLTASVQDSTATIGQYADYITFSDLSLQTAIDPTLTHMQEVMSYRLGQTIHALVQAQADSLSTVDSSVAIEIVKGTAFSRADITTAVGALMGRNVMPYEGSRYRGLIHPFAVADAINDTTTNSLTDVLKRTVVGQEKLEDLPGEDEVQVLEWGGVSFFSTNLVTITAAYQAGTAPAYRTYIFGKDALLSTSLGAKEDTQIGDGDWRNLKVWVKTFDEPSRSDPARVIGGLTSYNTKFVCSAPPDTVGRMRYIDATSNVS